MNTGNMNEIIELQEHSAACIPDHDAIVVAQFRDAIKTELRRQYYRLRDLYDLMALM